MKGLLSLAVASLLRLPLLAQSTDPIFRPESAGPQPDSAPAPKLAPYAQIQAPVVLRPAIEAAIDQLNAMDAWNSEGRRPKHIGINRPLPAVITADLRAFPQSKGAAAADTHAARLAAADGSTLWVTRVTVHDAYAIRLHLSNVHLPPGTRFWSYGTEGMTHTFGLELMDSVGDLWTPITFGDTAFLEVNVPAADTDGGFALLELAEIRDLLGSAEPACAQDAACVNPNTFSSIVAAMSAVAQIDFQTPTGPAGCTGTLLNDKAGDFAPYFLTANHCISTQTEAASLQAFWDFHAPSCGGVVPPLSSLPTTMGATLLANGESSDFSFLRLSSAPGSRYFMGWDTATLAPGTTLNRVAFPDSVGGSTVYQQQFATCSVDTVSTPCLGALRPNFIYSRPQSGYVYDGASGSAAMLDNGRVVGQLKGSCPATSNPCLYNWESADGAFAATYPAIAQWLNASAGVCVATQTSLCLNNRFSVTAAWQKADGTSGQGTAISLTPDTGYFWFFDQTNVELITKVLNGCGLNNRYWLFGSGLTNVGVTLTATDISTNTTATYHNAVGVAFQPIQDTAAFATCP